MKKRPPLESFFKKEPEELEVPAEQIAKALRGKKGDKGDTPTKDDIREVAEPVIADLLSVENLEAVILPLIPEPEKGDKGDTPSISELAPLIESLIPAPVKGDDGYTPIKGIDYTDGIDGAEITPKDVIDKINKSRGEKIKRSRVEGLEDIENKAASTEKRLQNVISLGGSRSTAIKASGVLLGTGITTVNFVGATGAKVGDGSEVNITTGGGSGTVNSVVAGTGISVNNTDPANPIVSSTVTGTVTNVSSADANATITSPTTTPVITVVSAPKLATARTINGVSFDGTANITVADSTKTPTTRTISTTAPLSGGGDLSADRTLTTSMATNKLIGRGTAGTGVMEEITIGTGLSLTGTTLSSTGGSGTPGGIDKNMQYNNAGSFGGITNNSTATPKYFKQVSSGTPTIEQIADSDLSFTDITTNNVTSSQHGYAPKLSGSASDFLSGAGTYIKPSSGDLVYVDGSVPGGNTIANTTTETAFTSSYTIPAGTLIAGNVIRLRVAGLYSTNVVAPNITAKIKFGSVVVATTGAITAVAAVTNGGYTGFVDIIVTNAGASGVVESQGYLEFATAATTALSVNMTNTAAVTAIDFTATQAITITITWSAANASNSVTMRQMEVYIDKISSILGATAGGDLSGTYPNPTVIKINGTQLSGLATGLLKNTTGTGVPSIATAGIDYQAPITLTTTGTSGAATFVANTLNIPQYSGGGITRSVNVISSPQTAGATASTDYVYFVSGATTLTLPTAVGNTNTYRVVRTGTSTVTIATTSSQTIAGASGGPSTTVNLITRYAQVDLISDGSNWYF